MHPAAAARPTSSIRPALLSRRPCIGTWLQIGHPTASELLGSVGFGWIAVDCDHTDHGDPQPLELGARTALRAARPVAA